MSLINQMLNDLDARRAEGGARRLPNEVRPLPALRRRSLLPIGIALLALGGVVWVLVGGPGKMLLSESGSTPGANAVSVESPGLPTLAEVPDAARPATSMRGQPGEPALRLAWSVRLPSVAPVSAARETPAAPSPAVPLPAPKTEVPPAHTPAAPAIEASPSIEKQLRAPSLRERSDAALRAAIGLVNQGRTDVATEALRAVLREDPGHHASRQLLLKLLVDARAHDELRSVLMAGLERSPQQVSWALLLSRLLVDKGEGEAALKVLQAPEIAAAATADVHGAMAAILQRLGRHAEAESQYAQAVRLESRDGRWWLGLGLAREAQGKAAESREAWQQARSAGNLSPELQAFLEQKLR